VDTEDDIYLLAQFFINKAIDNELEGTDDTEHVQPTINIENDDSKITDEEKQEMDGMGDDGMSEKSSVSFRKTGRN